MNTFKKNDLFTLNDAFESVSQLKGVKFAYVIAKNKNILKGEIDSLQESVKMSEQYLVYEKKRVELCRELARKDKDGKPMMIGSKFDIEDKAAFDKTLKKLQDGYPAEIKEREKQLENFEKLCKEEIKIDLHKMKQEDLPEDITPSQIEGIIEIIEE